MNVLIDPYMFELSDEQEIYNNIGFFRKIIKMCENQNHEHTIALYEGICDNLANMAFQPFPIQLNTIRDRDLKSVIMQINKKFCYSLLPSIEKLEINECSGEQELEVLNDPSVAEDEKYFEMLYTLLIPCYSSSQSIDKRILTGVKRQGKQIGDNLQIKCGCTEKTYLEGYIFTGVDDFISRRDHVIEVLKQKRKRNEIIISQPVIAERGDHHNHVQRNDFHILEDLTAKNKIVLKLLQKIGLSKIIFGGFTPNGMRTIGTMNLQNVREETTQDIVIVKFYAETGMQLQTDLYFQKGIGKLLGDYFQSELLTYKNVSELLEKIY